MMALDTQTESLISLRSIHKRFPGVRALAGVSLDLYPGEVLGLVGENGAGKSTLIKILGGIYSPDEGEVIVDGQHVHISSPRKARSAGIGIIHQELNLSANLSIAENIFLGRQPYRGPFWFQVTDTKRLHRMAGEVLHKIGFHASTTTLVDALSVGQQQMVEIAKALSEDVRAIIFDEPTSSLSQAESGQLFEVIREMRRKGMAILYVSHRLAEVMDLADRLVILRDGVKVATLARREFDHNRIVSLMVGRDVQQWFPGKRRGASTEDALSVTGLRMQGNPNEFTFNIKRGEITGLAGLVGAGRTELARGLFGMTPLISGEIRIQGSPAIIRSPRDAIRAGLYLLPEDRKMLGAILEMSVARNVTLAALPLLFPRGLIDRAKEEISALQQVRKLSIRTPSLHQPVLNLSGGNQQKVVLAKWLLMKPQVLILDEPTRGVDVGAKSEIYSLIVNLAAEGVGILLISSEMEEIIALSDRVIVMHEGRLSGELSLDQISEERIMRLAVGN